MEGAEDGLLGGFAGDTVGDATGEAVDGGETETDGVPAQ